MFTHKRATDNQKREHVLCADCKQAALIHNFQFHLVKAHGAVEAQVAAYAKIVGPVYMPQSVWQRRDVVLVATAVGSGLPITWHIRIINLGARRQRHMALCQIQDLSNLRFISLTGRGAA